MGAESNNELLRDKLQIKGEYRQRIKKEERKREVEIWSGDNNATKETESLSQKPPGRCHVTPS